MGLDVEVRFPSGRQVRLHQFHLLPIGVRRSANHTLLTAKEWLPTFLATAYGPGDWPVLIKDEGESWRKVLAVASFSSEAMVKVGVTIEESFLIVCWYTDSADKPVRQLVCEALANVEWELVAKDFYSDW